MGLAGDIRGLETAHLHSVGRGKEGKNVGDKVLFIRTKLAKIVGGKVNLFGGPERCYCLFIEFPLYRVLDRKDNKAVHGQRNFGAAALIRGPKVTTVVASSANSGSGSRQ